MKKQTIITLALIAVIGTAFALDWSARKKQREILKNASNV